MAGQMMKTWITLLRGINVGGNNFVPMAALKRDLEAVNFENVRTYIQSGNVIFDSAAGSPASLAEKIKRRIGQLHGFHPHVLILEPETLLAAIAANPFSAAVSDPARLHFFFLAESPSRPDPAPLEGAKSSTECYRLTDRVFYLHAPDGIARSKLAANAEKHLGVVVTARNFRSVEKIASMATSA
jgi:uncharacterized protein (DUF1697 family)